MGKLRDLKNELGKLDELNDELLSWRMSWVIWSS